MKHPIKLYIVWVLLLFLWNSSTAQEHYVDGLRGANLKIGESFDIEGRYYQCGNCAPSISTAKLYTKLWFEESLIKDYPDEAWNLTVEYSIALANIEDTLYNQSLTINFNPDSSYQDIDLIHYSSADGELPLHFNYALVEVTDISSTSNLPFSITSLPEFIHLDLELEIERVHTDYDPEKFPKLKRKIYNEEKNELSIYWDDVRGAEDYEFEFLVLEGDNDFLKSPINYDFRKATRISTKSNSYTISMAYPESILLFRLRSIGYLMDDGEKRWIEGKWSVFETGETELTNEKHYYKPNVLVSRNSLLQKEEAYYWKGLEAEKNWQYSAVFAEEGKKKEVITFADGLLMESRSVTVVNTDDNAIVKQPIRDWLGRESLQVLPSPQASKGMQWYEPLHFNEVGEYYSYKDFDLDGHLIEPAPLSSENNKGAGNYYSKQNEQALGINHEFVPDAEGYPFSRTLYLNDGTGRVKLQSGIGKVGYFENGKISNETKYFYDKPNQETLFMLFGNNAGFNNFYERTMVVDPNGQITAAYKDLAGRVIATSLIAEEPDNLLPIDSKPNDFENITTQLHTANERVDDIITINDKFTSVGGEYKFEYTLPQSSITSECGVEFKCSYDLEIKLLDEFGRSINLGDSSRFSNITDKSIDFVSDNLSLGSYQLVKKLQINEGHLDEVEAQYIAANLDSTNVNRCFEPNEIAPVRCETDSTLCEEAFYSPENEEGIRYIFDLSDEIIGTLKAGETTIYEGKEDNFQAVQDSIASCEIAYENNDYEDITSYPTGDGSDCDIKYELLKADMSPGGQYFDDLPNFDPNGYNKNAWLENNISLYQTLNDFSFSCASDVPPGGGDGKSISTVWDTVRTVWRDEWADFFIQFHPEYCVFKQRCCAEACLDEDCGGGEIKEFNYVSNCSNSLSDEAKAEIEFLIERRKSSDSLSYQAQSDSIISNLGDTSSVDLTYFSAERLEQRERHFLKEYFLYKEQEQACEDCREARFDSYFTFKDNIDQETGLTSRGFLVRYPRNSLFENLNFDNEPQAIIDTFTNAECGKQAEAAASRFVNLLICIDELNTEQQILFRDAIESVMLNQCQNDTITQQVASDRIANICENFGLERACYAHALPIPPEGSCECNEIFSFVKDVLENGGNTNFNLYTDETLADSVQNALDFQLQNPNLKSQFRAWFRSCQTYTTWQGDNIAAELDASFLCNFDDFQGEEINIEDCGAEQTAYLREQERIRFEQEVREAAALFRERYKEECLAAALAGERLSKTYSMQEYHWTLYYYDQAGNLVQTVPPEGIYQHNGTHNSLLNPSEIEQAKQYLNGTSDTPVYPKHVMESMYKYNSLNNVERQLMPDHGDPESRETQISEFYYDALGRLLLSQNPYQRLAKDYSYLQYDALGRTVEAGELRANSEIDRTLNAYTTKPEEDFYQSEWFTNATKKEYTQTYYSLSNTLNDNVGMQKNLRNRIAMIKNHEFEEEQAQPSTASYFSYDVQGNVTDLWQENFNIKNAISPDGNDNSIKHFGYQFDIVSGNVNEVNYQAGKPDQFSFRYLYDADNRITHVFSSTNDIIWNNEATYFYYAHGPMARTEIGQNKVFADDYIYSIGGWLVAKNASTLNEDRDAGMDGKADALNANVGLDPFAFSLHYFKDVYKPISDRTDVLAQLDHPEQETPYDNLYNGNIPNMVVSMRNTSGKPMSVMAYGYKYDQLNRIKEQRPLWHIGRTDPPSDPRVTNNFASTSNRNGEYNTSYTFDGNGNLKQLIRKGVENYLDMDKFAYQYDTYGGLGSVKKSNRLIRLRDDEPPNRYPHDIEGLQTYEYDALGRLTTDPKEDISAIHWNVSNKVKKIEKSIDNEDGQNADLLFNYDAMGYRIGKTVIKKDGSGNLLPIEDWKNTWYVRDSQGNPIAIYEYQKEENGVTNLVLKEFILYGTDRLGTKQQNIKVYD